MQNNSNCIPCVYINFHFFQSSSDDFSTMDEDELVRLEHDTYQVHKLKEKCKRLVRVPVWESLCMSFM